MKQQRHRRKIKINHIAYVGLGSNLGNSQELVKTAMIELDALPATQLSSCSSLYFSAPIDAIGDNFVNAVVELRTELSPTELLSELQKIESHFGRTRDYLHAPRTLDLDLLLYDQVSITTPNLQIPHPRMTQRAFVMLPLLEIAPEIVIPAVSSAQSLLAGLENQVVQKIA